jgi:hypothetical protein
VLQKHARFEKRCDYLFLVHAKTFVYDKVFAPMPPVRGLVALGTNHNMITRQSELYAAALKRDYLLQLKPGFC